MAEWLPLHPRFVHFPIALLVTGSVAALVYLLGWRRAALPGLAWFTLLLGWLSLFTAVLTGLIDQNNAPQEEAVTALLNPHAAIGYGLLVTYGLLLYLRLRSAAAMDDPSRRIPLLALLIVGLALVLAEGWLGGKLVFDLGVGVTGA